MRTEKPGQIDQRRAGADSLAQARDRLSEAVAHLDGRLGKVATTLDDAEFDILAFYSFPSSHWRKLRSTNPLERFNKEIGRRTDVVDTKVRTERFLAVVAIGRPLSNPRESPARAWKTPLRL